jgi:hypothetical protein
MVRVLISSVECRADKRQKQWAEVERHGGGEFSWMLLSYLLSILLYTDVVSCEL